MAYAAERHVTVVPEIEMPGHAIAAIRAFPELSCTGEAISTFYTWGSPNIVMCPGKDVRTSYSFKSVRKTIFKETDSGTYQERIVKYLLKIGVPQADIDDLRKIMLK